MITGSIVALITPMLPNGGIDWPALDKLIAMHIAQGTNGIVAMGTTGESATLDVNEHLAVIDRVIQTVAGQIPVIAGTGANSTSEALELTQKAKNMGADAALLVTPYYNKPTQHGLILHHQAIARAVDLPQILYNVPGRTGVDMLPETVMTLSAEDNIIGVKEATGDLVRGKNIIEHTANDFYVYSGDDETATELMLLGAKGDISVTANVAPALMSQMCQAAITGNAELARQLNSKLVKLHHALFLESNPIPVKWALFKQGVVSDGIRLPLTVLSENYHATLINAMQDAGVLS